MPDTLVSLLLVLVAAAVTSSGAAAQVDFDLDGVADVIVRDPKAPDCVSPSMGRVVVISGANAAPIAEFLSPLENSLFGFQAESILDVDGGGMPDLYIAAPGSYLTSQAVGRIHLFRGEDFSELFTIYPPHGAILGWDLGLVRDMNADGFPDLISSALISNGHGVLEPSWILFSGANGELLGAGKDVEDVVDMLTLSPLASAVRYPNADVNKDGVVDYLDIAEVAQLVGQQVEPASPGDVVVSGKIDSNDVAAIHGAIGAQYDPLDPEYFEEAMSLPPELPSQHGAMRELFCRLFDRGYWPFDFFGGSGPVVVYNDNSIGFDCFVAPDVDCIGDHVTFGIQVDPADPNTIIAAFDPATSAAWEVPEGTDQLATLEVASDGSSLQASPIDGATGRTAIAATVTTDCVCDRTVHVMIEHGPALSDFRIAGSSAAYFGDEVGLSASHTFGSTEAVQWSIAQGHQLAILTSHPDGTATLQAGGIGGWVSVRAIAGGVSRYHLVFIRALPGVDSDLDGVLDECESSVGSDALDPASTGAGLDRDLDGITDTEECSIGTDPRNHDTDGDGLSDGVEVILGITDPLLFDTDGNGVSDGDEDADADGLSNYLEETYGTDLLDSDSDGDGESDGDEASRGGNPNLAGVAGEPVLHSSELYTATFVLRGDPGSAMKARFGYQTFQHSPSTSGGTLEVEVRVRPGHVYGIEITDFTPNFIDIYDGDGELIGSPAASFSAWVSGFLDVDGNDVRDLILSGWQAARVVIGDLHPANSYWPCPVGWGSDAVHQIPGYIAVDPFNLVSGQDQVGYRAEHQKTVSSIINFIGVGAASHAVSSVITNSPGAPDPKPNFGGMHGTVPALPPGHLAVVINSDAAGRFDVDFMVEPNFAFGIYPNLHGAIIPQGSSVKAVVTRTHIAQRDADENDETFRKYVSDELSFALIGPYERRVLIDECQRTFDIDNTEMARYDALTDRPSHSGVTVLRPASELVADVDNDEQIGYSDRRVGDQGLPQTVPLPGDADGDAVPDFADWVWSEPDSFSGVRSNHLEEIHLGIGEYTTSWADGILVRFSYSFSDPQEITRVTGDYTDQYTPGPGAFRIWAHDGLDSELDPRPLKEGGDLIVPEIDYTLSELSSALSHNTYWGRDHLPVYVESVSLPTSAAESKIRLRVDDTVSSYAADLYPWTDEIQIEPIGFRFREVVGNTIGEAVEYPEHSHPVPSIQVSLLELSAPAIDTFNDIVVGQLDLSLTITDELSSMVNGPEGQIPTVAVVYTNANGDEEFTVVPVDVTKGQQDDLSAPFPYYGVVNATVHIPLSPGSNTIQIFAENALGHRALVERTWDLSVQTPEIVHEYELDFAFPEASEFALIAPTVGVRHRLAGDEEWSEQIFLHDPELDGTFVGFGDHSDVALVFPPTPILDPSAPDRFVGTISNLGVTEASFFAYETGNASQVFLGQHLEQAEYDDIPLSQTVIGLSDGSDILNLGGSGLSRYVIEVIGSQDRLAGLTEVVLGETALTVIERDGSFFLNSDSDEHARLSALYIVGYGKDPSPFPGGHPFHPNNSGSIQQRYWAGVGEGMIHTGVDLVDGVATIGKLAWRFVTVHSHVSIIYRWYDPEGFETAREEDLRAIGATIDSARDIAGLMWELGIHEADLFSDMMAGDAEAIAELGEQYRLAFQFGHELVRAVHEELEDPDPYQTGYLVGRIIGEVLLEVVSLGAGTAINAASKSQVVPSVVSKIRSIDLVQSDPGLRARLDDISHYAATVLATTEMCFAAGTMVHTNSGLKAIESIELGDLVLARDEHTGEVGFKPVIDLIRTQPAEILEITFETGGRLETISTTPEHPFFVHGPGVFTLAGDLSAGDLVSSAAAHPWSAGGAAPAAVVSAARVSNTGPDAEPTYNFEVADWHTYHVGETGLWVHNASRKPCEQLKSWIDTYINDDLLTPSQAWERVEQSVLNGTPDIIPTRTIDDETMGLAVELLTRDLRSASGKYLPPDDVELFVPGSQGVNNVGINLFREHYYKHVIKNGEFVGFPPGAPIITNALDYVDSALDFLLESHSSGTKLVGLRPNTDGGLDKIVADMHTGEFAICKLLDNGEVGSIRTYFQLSEDTINSRRGNTRAEKIKDYFINRGIKTDGVEVTQ